MLRSKVLWKAGLIGVVSGAALASQNLAFLTMGYAVYLIHGLAYLAFFYPNNPLFTKGESLYVDRPLFATEGRFPIVLNIACTLISVAIWSGLVGMLIVGAKNRLKLALTCVLIVVITWVLPMFIWPSPDSLVAPLPDGFDDLARAVFPLILMSVALGWRAGGRRFMLLAAGVALITLVIGYANPVGWHVSRWIFDGTSVSKLVEAYDNDRAEPLLQTLAHHYWRCAEWTLLLLIWSTALCVSIEWLKGHKTWGIARTKAVSSSPSY